MEQKTIPPIIKIKEKRTFKRNPWNKGKKGVQIPWNKGIKVDRAKYPKMGAFGKRDEESRLKMSESRRRLFLGDKRKESIENAKMGHASMIRVRKEKGNFIGTLGKKGDKSYVWLGDKATYNSKHRWIQKNWTKTGICHRCGLQARPYGKCLSGTHWHNINKDYNRNDTSGWVELCPKCHLITHKECN